MTFAKESSPLTTSSASRRSVSTPTVDTATSGDGCRIYTVSFGSQRAPLPKNVRSASARMAALERDERRRQLLAEARRELSQHYADRERETLRTLRMKKGLSQQSLSTAIGTSQSRLSRIENGKEEPGLKVAKRLADSLGVSLDRLYDLIEESASGKNAAESRPENDAVQA